MKRIALLVTFLTMALALSATPAAAGQVPLTFSGTTSQGEPIDMTFVHLDIGGEALQEFDVQVDLSCPSGQVTPVVGAFFFSDFGLPLRAGRFKLNDVNEFQALHLKGTLTPTEVTRSVKLEFPAFTPDEQLEVCASGIVTFDLTPPVSSAAARVAHPDVRVSIHQHADGRIMTRVQHPTPSTRTGSTRLYKGRTSQGRRMLIRTHEARHPFVRETEFNFRIGCDDGTSQLWGIFFGFGGPQVRLHHRRFGFDEVGFNDAFHVHGRLGPHKGHGDVTWSVPEFMPDETVMLCTSSMLSWHAHHILRSTSAAATRVPAVSFRRL